MALKSLARRLLLLAMLGVLVSRVGVDVTAGADGPATHTVIMEDLLFQPEVLTVKAGDTVVWVNKDFFPHTASSEAGGFDSQVIPAGKTWTYKTGTAGEFPYICALHPTMKGTLRVE